MSDCIFCKIADGEVAAQTVYEDEFVVAFLDANPLTEGHTLVIPKEHYDSLGELSAAEAQSYFAAVPRIVRAVEKATGADGTTIAWNNGRAAGQEVDHLHLHIVPRTSGDGHGPIHALFDGTQEVSDERKRELANDIEQALTD